MIQQFMQVCAEFAIKTRQFTPYQYRFWIEDGRTYDYYPVSGKVNEVGTKKYFIPEGGIVEFIINQVMPQE